MTAIEGETLFAGHEGRECGEHRPVNSGRAWCFNCSEWCYPEPDMACRGCELPMLRSKIEQQETEIAEFRYWFKVCPYCEGRDYATEEGQQVRSFCPVCQHSGFVRKDSEALQPTTDEARE